MSSLVEVPFEGGLVVFSVGGQEGAEAYSTHAVSKRAEAALEDVLDTVTRIGENIGKKLSEIECAGAEVQFGVSFTGKGKFIVSEASASAALTFTLKFN